MSQESIGWHQLTPVRLATIMAGGGLFTRQIRIQSVCRPGTVWPGLMDQSMSHEYAASTLLSLASDRNTMNEPDHDRAPNLDTVGIVTTLKQHAEMRKANKPLMEKRRRARINKSLNELKSILIESVERNPSGHSKWEKADILEMTVQYLRCLRNQRRSSKTDPLAAGQFIAGYSECVRQVQKFSVSSDSSSPEMNTHFSNEVQERLIEHLLFYLKSYSDDATRSLPNQSTNYCLSPADTICLGPADERSSGSRRSTLSTLTSLSSSEDGMDLEGSSHRFSVDDQTRKDVNNNPQGLPNVTCHVKEISNHTLWRPW